MKKKMSGVLKLSKETLHTLNPAVLNNVQGAATAVCTVRCPSGTICSCGQTEISCWDTCATDC